MIRHMVMFAARDPKDKARMIEGLRILCDNPHADLIEVQADLGLDALNPGAVDAVVYAEFTDAAALAAFKAHETYAQSIAAVRPLRELRLGADVMAT